MNRRKELQREYKQRPIVGGVYAIRNTQTGVFCCCKPPI